MVAKRSITRPPSSGSDSSSPTSASVFDAQHLGRLGAPSPWRGAWSAPEQQAGPAEHAAARHAPQRLARANLGLEDVLDAARAPRRRFRRPTSSAAVDARARGIASRPRDRRDAREQRPGGLSEGRGLAQHGDRVVAPAAVAAPPPSVLRRLRGRQRLHLADRRLEAALLQDLLGPLATRSPRAAPCRR